jgi:SNF2 family DNA or RNA helicase
MLWLDMGLGKTAICLTYIAQAIDLGIIKRALIVAPLRPAKVVWEAEALKWSHTRHLTFAYALGTPRQRLNAVFSPADIIIINYENLEWLTDALGESVLRKDLSCVRSGKTFPYDMAVLDEITYVKRSTSHRSKAFKHLLPFIPRIVGLTGTPAANGLTDLHGQFLAVDGGQRLGRTKEEFTNAYFTRAGPYKLEAKSYAWDVLRARVSDITLEMSAKDYLTLPPLTTNDIYVGLNGSRDAYERLEKDFFTEIDNGTEIEVFNRASLSNKLRQFANGACYRVQEDGKRKEWEKVHDAKLDALDEILKETGDAPILLGYQFRHDWERIKKKYPDAETLSGTTAGQTQRILDRFKRREFRLLCGHPKSMGHGIDGLQEACNTLVSFGLGWDADSDTQLTARIARQGQTKPVIHHRLLAKDTVDDLVRISLENKVTTQADFRAAVKLYREQKGATC